jgi:hypothetical protein
MWRNRKLFSSNIPDINNTRVADECIIFLFKIIMPSTDWKKINH